MKSKIEIKLITLLITTIFAFSFFTPILASPGGSYNFKTQSGLNATANAAGYKGSLQTESLEFRISSIITAVLSIIGILFLILLIYGGYIWMMAGGNEEEVKRATQILTEAVIGLIVVLSAYSISWFLLNYFWK